MKRLVSFVVVAAIIACLGVSLAEGILQVGSKGDEVVRLQTRLIELGYLSGKADGSYGEMTKSAVKAFQEQLAALGYVVDADGIAGNSTKEYLYADNPDIQAPDVVYGSKGELVTQLQKSLVKIGLVNCTVDGVFGDGTKSAIMQLQQAMIDAGIEKAKVTGEIDDVTREVIANVPSGVKALITGNYDSADPARLTDRNLYASSCILINADNGDILYKKNVNDRVYPASTTKIMTLLLAVENGSLDSMITIPEEANEVPWDSSVVPVTAGEKMPFIDLLYGLMIKSGNDAANAVACIIGGSVDGFVSMMNNKAAQLGMTQTHFTNPHGYHDQDHYTTSLDMARLTYNALKNDAFKRIISEKSYTMAATKNRKSLLLENTYSILNPSSESYYQYAYGIKTGYTSIAGQCYVGAAEKNGTTLVAVIMHSGLERVYKWRDAKRLFEYGFANLGL